MARRIIDEEVEIPEELPLSAQLRRNFVVKTQIGRIEKPKAKTGRPKKFTPTKMKNSINKYFQWCEENDRVPSIKGMMLHLKMMREQFYDYIAFPEFKDIMEQAKLVIVEWVENDVYRTPGQCAGKIAYMKNVHNWADKIDTTNVNENRNTTVLSVEDARAKIASLAHLINPALLETLHSGYVVNQLSHEPVIEAEAADGK